MSKESNLSADLIKIASEKGFIISDNPASGNCMFYALSEQLQCVKGSKISQRELREKLVRFLSKNPNLVSQSGSFKSSMAINSWNISYLFEFKSLLLWTVRTGPQGPYLLSANDHIEVLLKHEQQCFIGI